MFVSICCLPYEQLFAERMPDCFLSYLNKCKVTASFSIDREIAATLCGCNDCQNRFHSTLDCPPCAFPFLIFWAVFLPALLLVKTNTILINCLKTRKMLRIKRKILIKGQNIGEHSFLGLRKGKEKRKPFISNFMNKEAKSV